MVRTSLGFRVTACVVALACAAVFGARRVGAATVQFSGGSVATVVHDAGAPPAPVSGGPNPFTAPIPRPAAPAVQSAPFNPHTFTYSNGGNTRARAGVAHSTTSTRAKIAFPTGMGVSQ